MLLRSASTPIMKTWSHTRTHHSSCEFSVSTTSPTSWSPKNRTLSETDLKELSSSTERKSTPNAYCSRTLLEDIESDDSEISSIDEVPTSHFFKNGDCGSGGGGGSENGGGNDNENEMDAYYKNAIKENPGSGLILGNYARFLKQVKGDVKRAKEHCERAILAKSDDGYVLAMYGELIWESQRDGLRANTYFDQAVKSAPQNCYVLGSYARFMWDAGEEDEEAEESGSGREQGGGGLICRVEKKANLMKSFALLPLLPPMAASS